MQFRSRNLLILAGACACFALTALALQIPHSQASPPVTKAPIAGDKLAVKPQLKVRSPLQSLTEVNGQLIGAAANRLDFLDDAGAVTKSLAIKVARPSISPLGKDAVVVGDLDSRTIIAVDLASGQSKGLLRLADVKDPNSALLPSGALLGQGEFRSVASDGKHVFIAIAAGFSSAVYKIDPTTQAIVARTWASAADPDAMTFHEGGLFVLVQGGSQVRRFSSALERSLESVDLGVQNAKGLAIRADTIRVLTENVSKVTPVAVDKSKLTVPSILERLDKVRVVPGKIGKIKFPPLNLRKRYAVLITGDLAENFAGECFWNDTVWMFKSLLNNGYSEDDIIVLYGDGADYVSANAAYRHPTTVTDFAATPANVNLVLDGLKNGDAARGIPKVDANDTLFLWTFDHGGQAGGEATLCLRGGQIGAAAFSAKLNLIAYEQRAIFMQQCFSGGFIDPLKNNKTFIATASRADEVARPADSENEMVGGRTYSHGEFNYHITSALNRLHTTPPGGAVNADANADGWISSLEMGNWNVSHESRPETPQSNDMGGIGGAFRFQK